MPRQWLSWCGLQPAVLWAPPVTGLVFRFATVSGQRIDWRLVRNCSVTPAQMGWMYLSLCAVSLGIATFFWLLGARLVMPFAWLEIVVVGLAFATYGRHAADGERISLQGSRLVVELETAGKLQRAEFDRSWVRVEPKTGDRSLITLSGQGRSVEVGRYVRPELRPALASEIRMALRAA
jgi:uncharacterized membrane protein